RSQARSAGGGRPMTPSACEVRIPGAGDAAGVAFPGAREDLLARSPTRSVFQTLEWSQAWWEFFGRGLWLPVLASDAGGPVALAPFYADCGMVYLVGSGGSDYLDVLGTPDAAALAAILDAARARTPDFLGFVFYHVPEGSPTGALLARAAAEVGLVCVDQGDLGAPAIDLAGQPGHAHECTRKASLIRHEKGLRKAGEVEVSHVRTTAEILPHLDGFFEQHVARWANTAHPSLFNDPVQRRFYARLTELAGPAGWLRFTRVTWQGRPVAYHFGFCYRGSYLWYKPSFDVSLARYSPGEVLLRHLLLAAIDEGAHTFDFGLGEEPFKARFATHVPRVRTWGLYPPSVLGPKGGSA
ncbi:MAG: GNAT family N-acetyltransferase, partial [Phycisphaerae bacterium]